MTRVVSTRQQVCSCSSMRAPAWVSSIRRRVHGKVRRTRVPPRGAQPPARHPGRCWLRTRLRGPPQRFHHQPAILGASLRRLLRPRQPDRLVPRSMRPQHLAPWHLIDTMTELDQGGVTFKTCKRASAPIAGSPGQPSTSGSRSIVPNACSKTQTRPSPRSPSSWVSSTSSSGEP